MTTYAEAQVAARAALQMTADGEPIEQGTRIWTPALCPGRVLEVAHSMDEIAPGVYEAWHLVKLDSGLVTAYSSDLLYGRSPATLPAT